MKWLFTFILFLINQLPPNKLMVSQKDLQLLLHHGAGNKSSRYAPDLRYGTGSHRDQFDIVISIHYQKKSKSHRFKAIQIRPGAV